MIIVRFADDFIVGFEYEQDARRFLDELRERFARFGLELHPDKTRLIEFGRHAAIEAAAGGVWASRRRSTSWALRTSVREPAAGGSGCGVSRSRNGCGRSWPRSRPSSGVAGIDPIPVQGRWLASVLQGHVAYYAVPGQFRRGIGLPVPGRAGTGGIALRRRSQRGPDHLGADGHVSRTGGSRKPA